MKTLNMWVLILMLTVGLAFSAYAGKADCENIDGDGAKPIKAVGKEDVGKQNDYDKVVEEDDRQGVTYLTFIGGSTPKPNKCGLNPKNPEAEWTGWGGPLDVDNATIGEGRGTRNHIVIGGIYFERGIGSHAIARMVYDLSGDQYLKFEGYIGMADEKDREFCNHGGSSDFIFSVDGKEVFKSDTLQGIDGGKQVEAVKVEFDIAANAKELEIIMGDGGDGTTCDHSAIGDAKLLNVQALAVEPANKLPTIAVVGPAARLTFAVPAKVSVEEKFTATLSVSDVRELSGAQFILAFNPAVLEVADVNEGDFLSQDGSRTFFQVTNIDNVGGELSGIRLARLGQGGVSGSGVLLQVVFRAKAAGNSPLTLRDVKLGSVSGDQIPSDVSVATVTVSPVPDVTGDGRVDILDLVLVSRHFGPASAAPAGVDINGDGEVDILDLILLAHRLGN